MLFLCCFSVKLPVRLAVIYTAHDNKIKLCSEKKNLLALWWRAANKSPCSCLCEDVPFGNFQLQLNKAAYHLSPEDSRLSERK